MCVCVGVFVYMLVSESVLHVYAVMCAAMHTCGDRSLCCCLLLLVACVLFMWSEVLSCLSVCMSSFTYVVSEVCRLYFSAILVTALDRWGLLIQSVFTMVSFLCVCY